MTQTAKVFENEPIGFTKHDGGREAAGYVGTTGDCTTRALAIVLLHQGKFDDKAEAYQYVYDEISRRNKAHWKRKRKPNRKTAPTARDYTYKKVGKQMMKDHGGVWTPTMEIGSGCQVHLRANELPDGVLVCSVSKHMCAVINHVVHDNHNPARGGTRCVYGYWEF